MGTGNAVWGIDIGQTALKAVKLRAGGDQVELVAFDVIEHPKILSQPDAEPEELVRAALDKFLSRNDWQGDQFVIGVPGQQTFARFCKLPPVDQKKIPDIVKFEASQQIPFDMDEVVWDYQVFSSPDSPDVEVGIFAIKKDLIRKHLEYFNTVGIAPIAVQTHPSALYNFCKYDQWNAEQPGATVIVDIGAQNTDLIVAEANSAWSRNIPLGGNNFTEALVKAFKLSFGKAESLKKTAATSKYARQIFQAMRPVFADLVAEIQRSIGFYSSTHRDVELTRVLGLGNAFRLPGLQKYLENNLTIAGGVTKVEKFNMLVPSATINAPQFTDNVLSFGVAYGLGLQGLGLASISASLLPQELARVAMWNKKRPYFMAAAASLAMAATFVWGRQFLDSSALASGEEYRAKTTSILAEATDMKQKFSEVSTNTDEQNAKVQQFLGLHKDKRLVPLILAFVHEAIPEPAAPELAQVKSASELKKLLATDKVRFARTARKQIFIDTFSAKYQKDIDGYVIPAENTQSSGGGTPNMMSPGGIGGDFMPRGGNPRGYTETPQMNPEAGSGSGEGGAGSGGFVVRISGRLLYGSNHSDAIKPIENEFLPRLKEFGQRKGLGFYVMDEDTKNTDASKNLRFTVREARATGTSLDTMFRPNQENQPAATPTDPMLKKPVDPVTEEEDATDWAFDISFKVKLGDKPPPAETPPGDNPVPPTNP